MHKNSELVPGRMIRCLPVFRGGNSEITCWAYDVFSRLTLFSMVCKLELLAYLGSMQLSV